MGELLKNMYNRENISKLAFDLKDVYAAFEADEFIASIFDETWESLELKGRGRHITMNLGKYLPNDYVEAIGIINKVVEECKEFDGFIGMVFPDFVEVYGQDEKYWDISINALEIYTQLVSSEWAVRPFIIKDEKRMMAQMYAWSKHENEHVRRLSSEGCRPALPWAIALPKYKADPTPVLPILEQLKEDPSLYVRKSVANNLNDISKTHPDLVAKIAKEWYGKNELTDWIVKHGCRTLLKNGNSEALAVFGFHDANAVDAYNFALEEKSISIGEDITFSFEILAKQETKVRLEYGVDYVKANGKRNRKVFQISEISLDKDQKKQYTKKHSFADVSVRKHYTGIHSITLIVNGVERGTLDFELIM